MTPEDAHARLASAIGAGLIRHSDEVCAIRRNTNQDGTTDWPAVYVDCLGTRWDKAKLAASRYKRQLDELLWGWA